MARRRRSITVFGPAMMGGLRSSGRPFRPLAKVETEIATAATAADGHCYRSAQRMRRVAPLPSLADRTPIGSFGWRAAVRDLPGVVMPKALKAVTHS